MFFIQQILSLQIYAKQHSFILGNDNCFVTKYKNPLPVQLYLKKTLFMKLKFNGFFKLRYR